MKLTYDEATQKTTVAPLKRDLAILGKAIGIVAGISKDDHRRGDLAKTAYAALSDLQAHLSFATSKTETATRPLPFPEDAAESDNGTAE